MRTGLFIGWWTSQLKGKRTVLDVMRFFLSSFLVPGKPAFQRRESSSDPVKKAFSLTWRRLLDPYDYARKRDCIGNQRTLPLLGVNYMRRVVLEIK